MPILPHMVDERLRRDGVTLSQIRGAIPARFFRPEPLRSWSALIRIGLLMGICIYILRLISFSGGKDLLWQIPILISLWIVYGWVLVGLFLIGHDCGHQSFSQRPWVNSAIGYLCMSPLANSFHTWMLTHERHHAHTQRRGVEPDWASYLLTREEFESPVHPPSFITRLGYALPFGAFLWIYSNMILRGAMTRSMLRPEQFRQERFRLLWSEFIMLACLVILYGGLWWFCGFWGMLKYYGIPATIAMITGWLIITIQHASADSLIYDGPGWTSVRGQLVSTFDVRFPAWVEYLWCYGTIHIPHHVAPGIPWYYLKHAADALSQAFPDYYQRQNFGLRHLSWLYRTPFLKKIDDKGYYVFERA